MQPLSFWLQQRNAFIVVSDPDGGYFVTYPDLPGCITQVDLVREIGPAAEEIRVLWLETAHSMGMDIPPPRFRQDTPESS